MKKILGALVLVSLLAAACGSNEIEGTQQNNGDSDSNQNSSVVPPSPSPTRASQNSGNGVWKTTLLASDNLSKGKYKVMVVGDALYINTSRDYAKLLGKNVEVKYEGTIDNFKLIDIVAQ